MTKRAQFQFPQILRFHHHTFHAIFRFDQGLGLGFLKHRGSVFAGFVEDHFVEFGGRTYCVVEEGDQSLERNKRVAKENRPAERIERSTSLGSPIPSDGPQAESLEWKITEWHQGILRRDTPGKLFLFQN